MKHATALAREVDVYPVGALDDLRNFWVFRKHRSLRRRVRRLVNDVRQHGRSRNYWNGYLAEPTDPNEFTGLWRRCGHGWTKRRALRDLDRHMRTLADTPA